MAGAIDESTLRTIDDGRAAAGEVLSDAQTELQKIFIVFAIGFVGAFYALRQWVFAYLKERTVTDTEATLNALTTFDVVLLQTKVSMICGILIATPVLLYVSRKTLRDRGWLPDNPLSLWQLILLCVGVTVLFFLGLLYAHSFFLPLLFDFLISNAQQSGLAPHYSFVKWFRFLMLITLGMGIAAELPLFMVLLSYSNIVPYRTFRDKWRHAVVIIYTLGAVFTPPDPFTQVMWATPLLFLYMFSLLLTRFILTIKYSSDEFGLLMIAVKNWNIILGSMLLAGALVYWSLARGYGAMASSYLTTYGLPQLPPIESFVPLSRQPAMLALGAVVALTAGTTAYFIQLFNTVDPTEARYSPAPASAGDPSEVDLSRLDADSIAVAPPEVFTSMSEEEALEYANQAMERGNPTKAEAVLDRFDAAQETANAGGGGGSPPPQDQSPSAAGGTDDATQATAEESGSDNDVGNVITGTTAGVVSSFTEEEQSEDDIGGYFYDIQFILSSLTSKTFRIIGLFIVVMGGVFTAMYRGGLGALQRDFLRRLPEGVKASEVDIVPLHPVEGLIFNVKIAAVAGIVAVLPVLLYYIWPALKERGFVSRNSGNRGIIFMWTTTSLVMLVVGTIIGYALVAPTIISWLAYDAINSGMLIKYRISAAGWLVFFTTIGVGLLATVPTTLVFLHRSGFVPFSMIKEYWREAVVIIISVISVAAPGGVFGMLLFSLPVVGAYLVGVACLWLYTFGGRRVSPLRKSRQA
ncbi:twin-arginine translocase subunit TatC [Halocatena pleomorpha]|uniref:Preprotein translocase subunit TatC n=1 Tax=Halocatena pleomorpha TaxID=1785090 RepID=A0A3P3R4D3_9EURY|nr:twin-arginine translocase subunit TatC [Halocatena pleomorpha]RRJ28194.1 preprotein translocase subunit TatC [Halocatena pleomorpha]